MNLHLLASASRKAARVNATLDCREALISITMSAAEAREWAAYLLRTAKEAERLHAAEKGARP